MVLAADTCTVDIPTGPTHQDIQIAVGIRLASQLCPIRTMDEESSRSEMLRISPSRVLPGYSYTHAYAASL